MEAYKNLAEIYDELMDDVPYETWSKQVMKWLQAHHIDTGMLLELGCGTGTMTEMLAVAEYGMIGIDISEDMLAVAQKKKEKSGSDILYLHQDMREMELHGNVRAILSVCDAVNYILEPEELCQVFEKVNQYLEPNGVFIFDFNTEYKYREIMGDQVFTEDRDVVSYIWENDYDEESQINEYQLTLFVKEEKEKDLYRKYQEVHHQRGYTLEEMKKLLECAGLEFVQAYDDYSDADVRTNSERICVVAREKK